MIKLFAFIFSVSLLTFPQNADSSYDSFFQRENIIKFADHLFCEKDFLRAASEYLMIDETLRNEEINFKIALSLSTIGEYTPAKNIFGQIKESSSYYRSSRLEIMKIFFLDEKYSELREFFQADSDNIIIQEESGENKLYYISYLKDTDELPSLNNFVKSFDWDEQDEVQTLYQLKINPQNKNPIKASIFSVIIPGAGKIFSGEISDGILAFITTGLFSFLAYDNFKADHNFRGWLFSGLAAMFYAGNVYGSYASAQIYNARIKYEFNLQLDTFLRSKNYFIPEYDFCK